MICQLRPCRKLASRTIPVSNNVNMRTCEDCMLVILTSRVHFGQCCAPSCLNQITHFAKSYYTIVIGACSYHCDETTEIGKLFVEIKQMVEARNYDDLKQCRVMRVSPADLKAAAVLKLTNQVCLHKKCKMLANWCAEKTTPPILCNFHKPPDFVLYRTKLGIRRSNEMLIRFRNTDSASLRLRKIKIKRGNNICTLIKKIQSPWCKISLNFL